jgi:RecB family endonuclease NucS
MGNDGIDYPTNIGSIDILAIDKHGDFVVVELKIERSDEQVSGQVLGHMNWVHRYLAGGKGKGVRGYVIGSHLSDSVRYALANREDIALKEYELSIVLKDIAKP